MKHAIGLRRTALSPASSRRRTSPSSSELDHTRLGKLIRDAGLRAE